MVMYKDDVIKKIARETHFKKADVSKTVELMVDIIKDSLVSGDSVQLVGLGTFKVVETTPRKGRDTRTGAIMDIPSKKKAVFEPSKRVLLAQVRQAASK